MLNRPTDDQSENLFFRDSRSREGAAKLTVPKNADPVGDAPHLRQTVRDVDDRRADRLDTRDLQK